MKKSRTAAGFAILAAALYAVNVPLSKILIQYVEPTMMAAFLYLGAGVGLSICRGVEMLLGKDYKREPLTKKEFPYVAAMVLLDIAAPILLMFGISMTTSANVSLLNNFEIVATSLIALLIFHEVLSKRLWVAIGLVTLASVILGFEGTESLAFHRGSLFVLGACICWGFENNCTRMLSSKSSVEIVGIKGCFSGLGSLIVAKLLGEAIPEIRWILPVLLLGFVAYGLSIHFYILAQKELGAAKTSAYYSIAPFLGVAFSVLLLGEHPQMRFYVALAIMAVSTWLMVKDTIALQHTHEHQHIHTHEHRHGNMVHSHEHSHEHTHMHVHGEDSQQHLHGHEELGNHNHAHFS